MFLDIRDHMNFVQAVFYYKNVFYRKQKQSIKLGYYKNMCAIKKKLNASFLFLYVP